MHRQPIHMKKKTHIAQIFFARIYVEARFFRSRIHLYNIHNNECMCKFYGRIPRTGTVQRGLV